MTFQSLRKQFQSKPKGSSKNTSLYFDTSVEVLKPQCKNKSNHSAFNMRFNYLSSLLNYYSKNLGLSYTSSEFKKQSSTVLTDNNTIKLTKNKLLKLAQIIIITYSSYSFTQVGIGTTDPNPSAQLEVIATDRGILIPKISLTSVTDVTTITNGNVEGLLVYNINTASGLSLGYYYWSNTKWNKLSTSASAVVAITNNLTSTSAIKALSANQGKVLKGLVDVNTAKTGITTVQAGIIANTSNTNTGDQNISGIATNTTALGTKVDKVTGKELSANDFTDVLKTKVDGLVNTAVVNDLTTGGTTAALSAEQGKNLKGLVDTSSTAIGLNTAKVTNVDTDLTITGTTDARTIVSSDGTDAVIPVATTSVSGVMSTTLFDAVALNTLKTSGTTTTVVNDLTTGGTTNALSAEQGKTLQGSKAEKSNVLELDNTTAFTPNTDYEPATKKYVDNANTTVEDVLTSTSTANALSANQGRILSHNKLNKNLTSANLFIGNGLNDAESRTLWGDATLVNNGHLAIADNAVDGTDISLASEAEGDMTYFNGTDWVRLPKGTADQSLVMNTGATAPEWKSGGVTEGLINFSVNPLLINSTLADTGGSNGAAIWGSAASTHRLFNPNNIIDADGFSLNLPIGTYEAITNVRASSTLLTETGVFLDGVELSHLDAPVQTGSGAPRTISSTTQAIIFSVTALGGSKMVLKKQAASGTLSNFAFTLKQLSVNVTTVINPADATVIDDDTFASGTATNVPSAESVKAYVDANAGTADYSTTETLTGRKWIDGKPVYERVWTFDLAATADETIIISSADMAPVDQVVRLTGVANSTAGYNNTMNEGGSAASSNSAGAGGNWSWRIYGDGAQRRFKLTKNGYHLGSIPAHVIMEYTKN
ncbi:MAG: hypothetical protein V3U92_05260 [Cellulophaga sp.]